MTVIWDFDFESGDLTGLTQVSNDISVTQASALTGTDYGISVLFDDTTENYVYPAALDPVNTSGKYRARFYLDPNSLTMGNGENFWIFAMRGGGNFLAYVGLRKTTVDGFQIWAWIYPDSGGGSGTSYYNITDEPHYIEAYLQRASGSAANDGSLQLLIDGASQETVSGIDNYDRFATWNSFRLGAVAGKDAGTSGTFYLDQLIVNDDGGNIGGQTYIALGGTLTPDGGLVTEYTSGNEGETFQRDISRTLTPTGTIGKRTGKLVAGTLNFEGVGDWLREVWVSVGGTLTPDGAVAPLSALKVAISGALSGAGELAKLTTKSFSGGIATAGAVVKRVAKSFMGELTSGGLVANLKTYIASLAGEITPAGEIAKASRKPLAGGVAPDGGIAKRIAKAFAGALSWISALLTGHEAPSSFISLTLEARSVDLTLEARSVDLTLETRSVNLTLQERK